MEWEAAKSGVYRLNALRDMLSQDAETEELHSHNSQAFWSEVSNGQLLPLSTRSLWRVSVPPSEAPAMVGQCSPDHWMADWAGGLVWMGFADERGDNGSLIRSAKNMGGHATLVRAAADIRASVDVFEPQPAALAALNHRVKMNFDPRNILNPGRMVAHAD